MGVVLRTKHQCWVWLMWWQTNSTYSNNTSVEKITPEVIRNIKDAMVYTANG